MLDKLWVSLVIVCGIGCARDTSNSALHTAIKDYADSLCACKDVACAKDAMRTHQNTIAKLTAAEVRPANRAELAATSDNMMRAQACFSKIALDSMPR